MEYEVRRGEEPLGTHDYDGIQELFKNGTLRLDDAVFDPSRDRWVELSVFLSFAPPAPRAPSAGARAHPPADPARAAEIVRNLARYERISAVVWLIIAIIQILLVVTAIAGLWNIYACVTRFRMARFIESRDPGVPAAYERGLTWMIVMAVVNLSLGGVFAVVWIGFDAYVRSQVLKHRHIFES